MAAEKNTFNVQSHVYSALLVSGLCLLALVARLWYLQILQEDYFLKLSENNRTRTLYLPPPRGLILDRQGKVLVKNRPSFNIDFVSADSPKPEATIRELAQIIGRDPDELWAQVHNQRKRRPFEPKLVVMDASRDVVAKVAARRHRLPGVNISVTPTRDYVAGDLAAHLIGYIREISSKQLENPAFSGYRFGDLVGQAGVESKQEKNLMGEHGVQEVSVNATGTRIAESPPKPPISGHNVNLTLDLAVQQAADQAMSELRGAVVAMDPRTGEILAMTSSPRFNPNVFTSEISSSVWQDLVSVKEHRLINQAAQGTYPPGSVFKIFMAVAALSEGVISKTERVFCPGVYYVGSHPYRCHKKTGHGAVDLKEALIQSCDVYFYTVGQRLGVDRIHEYASRFGLGDETGLEMVEEKAGLVPSSEWKKKRHKNLAQQKWYPGETPPVSIGQGAVTLTPLQITRGVSALVNGGLVLRPYAVRGITSSDGNFSPDDISNFKPLIKKKLNVDPAILDYVREGLVGVVNDARGTAHRAQLDKAFKITVAGKTGTAQPASMELQAKGGEFKDHAWFSGFAPAENPEIVVTALIENGGHGGVAAAPVVKFIMEAYFRSKGLGQIPENQMPKKNSETVDTDTPDD